MALKITRKQRLIATIAISSSFFVAELVVGFLTHSLALIADAFHYLSDIIGIVIALIAVVVSERPETAPQQLSYGWQRSTVLGAFFNGVFLLALSVSILVQAIERFVDITPVENPRLVLIIGCIGFTLNIVTVAFVHEHDHGHNHNHVHEDVSNDGIPRNSLDPVADIASETASQTALNPNSHHEHKHESRQTTSPGKDLGMLGVLIHVLGDAINNLGVIFAALVIWKANGDGRYYADPAIGVFIALMILLSAVPLVKSSGAILLQVAPKGLNLADVKHDIETIPGIESVHELHVWSLNQNTAIASAHIVLEENNAENFADKARIAMECLHAYGIHSATLQPELPRQEGYTQPPIVVGDADPAPRHGHDSCQLTCGSLCDEKRCCTETQTRGDLGDSHCSPPQPGSE